MPEPAAAERAPERGPDHEQPARPAAAAGPPRTPMPAGPPALRLADGPAPKPGGVPPSVGEALSSPGEPLPAEVRAPLTRSLGIDASRVRVHRDERANKAAADLGVRAFAYGSDVYLASGERPNDLALIAHEIAHVVQQRGAPAVQLFTSAPAADPLEREAQHAAAATVRGAPAVVTGRTAPRVQGASTWQRVKAWGAERIEGAVEAVESTIWSLLERYLPSVVPILRQGVFEWLKERAASALQSFVESVAGPVRAVAGVAEALAGRFRGLVAWMREASGHLATRACEAVAHAAERVDRVVNGILEAEDSVLSRLKSFAKRVGGFFKSLWDLLGAPVVDFFRRAAGAVWETIVGIGRTIWDATAPIRAMAARLWSAAKRIIGIGSEPENQNGIIQWIQRKAGEAWDWVKARVEPIKRPLMIAGGILLMLSPAGPFIAIAGAVAGIVMGARWLWQHLRVPEAFARLRHTLVSSILPAIVGAVGRVTSIVRAAAQWIGARLGDLVSVAGSLVSVVATPVLRFAASIVHWVADHVRRLAAWAGEHLAQLAHWVGDGLHRLYEWVRPVLEVLKQIISIVANPMGIPGLLFGIFWRTIPTCLKRPLLRFILALVSGFLRLIPTPALGPIGAVIRAGLVGFVDKARSGQGIEQQEKIADRFALIATRGSWDFIVGYVTGLLKGLWSGISGPFVLLWDLAKLIGSVISWLWNLARTTVSTGFRNVVDAVRSAWTTIQAEIWPAIQGFFQGPTDPMKIINTIRSVIDKALGMAKSAGEKVFDFLAGFLQKPDREMGEGIGEVAGNILFEVLLNVLTAGGYAAKGPIQKLAQWATKLVGRVAEFAAELGAQFPRILRFVESVGEFATTNPAMKRIVGAVKAVLEKILGFLKMSYGLGGAAERGAARGERALTEAERAAAATERTAAGAERAGAATERRAAAAERDLAAGERTASGAERGIAAGERDLNAAERRMAEVEAAGKGEGAFNNALRRVRELVDKFVQKLKQLARDVMAGLGFKEFVVEVDGEWVTLYGIRSKVRLIRYRLSLAKLEHEIERDEAIVADLLKARGKLLREASEAAARGEHDVATTLRAGAAARKSEEIGARAAESAIAEHYAGAAKIFEGHGSGTLDLVFEQGGKIIVVEAKGGAGRIGSAIVSGETRAQQGTVTYLRSILKEMGRGTNEERAVAARIEKALEDGKLEFVLARTPLPSGTTEPLKTTLQNFVVR